MRRPLEKVEALIKDDAETCKSVSAFGTWRTSTLPLKMSALGGKADITADQSHC
jgi:hypothetical protein